MALISNGSFALSRNSTVRTTNRYHRRFQDHGSYIHLCHARSDACRPNRVGRFDNGAILRMRPGPASCDGSPEIVEHVPMKSDPLTRSEPNFPDAHAIGFRQKPGADSTIELICLELLANGAGPGRQPPQSR